MFNKSLFLAILSLVLFSIQTNAQCPPSSNFNSNFAGPAPVESDCSVFVESVTSAGTPLSVFSGETLTLNDVVGGQTYVVDLCGATIWDAVISVYSSDTTLIASDDGTASGCGMGARVSFEAPADGSYIITVYRTDCVTDFVSNGVVKVFNNTDGVTCPPSDLECTLLPVFMDGTPATGFTPVGGPIATCSSDWVGGDNFFPPQVFVAVSPYGDFANSPFVITTSSGSLYSGSPSGTPESSIVLPNSLIGLLALTEEDLLNAPIEITFTSQTNQACSATLTLQGDFLSDAIAVLCPAEFNCLASAPTVTPPQDSTYAQSDVSLAPELSDVFVNPEYATSLLLTTDLDTTDNISFDLLAMNETGAFDFGALELPLGVYNVHALSYNTSVGLPDSLASGEALTEAIFDGTVCGELTPPLYVLVIGEEEDTVSIGLAQLDLSEKMNLYPTLAAEYLTVEFDSQNIGGDKNNSEWQIVNLSGQRIRGGNLSNRIPNMRLDVTDLSSGIYFLQIAGQDFKACKKFVKE